ncbi:hypothetical protein ACR6C2_01090 [Streptomyces sp. INA 01156]
MPAWGWNGVGGRDIPVRALALLLAMTGRVPGRWTVPWARTRCPELPGLWPRRPSPWHLIHARFVLMHLPDRLGTRSAYRRTMDAMWHLAVSRRGAASGPRCSGHGRAAASRGPARPRR